MNSIAVKKYNFFFFISSILVLAACTKIVSTQIGGGLIPPVDGVATKEMFLDLITNNQKDTIIRVGTEDNQALGHINDPVFGEIDAKINVQLKPLAYPVIFPVRKDSLFLDSVVLVLSYKQSWADSSTNLALRVFEIAGDDPKGNLKSDSNYTTDYVVPAGQELTYNYTPKIVNVQSANIVDTIKAVNELISKQVRIKLNNSFGERLLYQYDSSFAYKNDSLFSSVFKGFQVRAEKTGNVLFKINLLDTNTKVALYYRNLDRDTVGMGADKQDTSVNYFRCNRLTCGSANNIIHNRSAGIVANYLNNGTEDDDLIFIDANPGIYARIKTPGLDTIANKVIHRAEILMTQVPYLSSDRDKYFTPPALFLTTYNDDPSKRFATPNDILFSNGTVSNLFSYGCFPKTKKDAISGRESIYYFSFDVSRYLQGIVTKSDTVYNFMLFTPYKDLIRPTSISDLYLPVTPFTTPLNDPALGNIMLGGGSHSKYKMRLHIVYSEIK